MFFSFIGKLRNHQSICADDMFCDLLTANGCIQCHLMVFLCGKSWKIIICHRKRCYNPFCYVFKCGDNRIHKMKMRLTVFVNNQRIIKRKICFFLSKCESTALGIGKIMAQFEQLKIRKSMKWLSFVFISQLSDVSFRFSPHT